MGLEGVVLVPLLAHRRGRLLADLLAAGRARRVARVDGQAVRQAAEAVHDGVVEHARQLLGLVAAE